MKDLCKYFTDTKYMGLLLFIYIMVGGFDSWLSWLMGLAGMIALLINIKLGKILLLENSTGERTTCTGKCIFAMYGIICLMYFLSIIWSVDSGLAAFGAMKCLSLAPYVYFICIAYPKENHLMVIPYAGCANVVLSILLFLTPLQEEIFPAERMAGLYGYPNTMGLVLVVGLMVLLTEWKFTSGNLWKIIFLVLGLLMTGSRISFLLLVIALVVLLGMRLFERKYQRIESIKIESIKIELKKYLLFGLIILLLIVCFFAFREVGLRIFRVSLKESTFIGRILYASDGIKLAIKYPFGLGYRGYSFVEGLTATGLYSVKFVHNSFLQLVLDIGIIPSLITFVLMLICLIRGLRGRSLILFMVVLFHFMLDFDSEFMGAVLCLLMILNSISKESPVKKLVSNSDRSNGSSKNIVITIITIIIMLLMAPLAGSDFAYLLNNNELALRLWPGNTDARVRVINSADNLFDVEEQIKVLYKRNPRSATACQMMGIISAFQGAFDESFKYFDEELELLPYQASEYNNYIRVASQAIEELEDKKNSIQTDVKVREDDNSIQINEDEKEDNSVQINEDEKDDNSIHINEDEKEDNSTQTKEADKKELQKLENQIQEIENRIEGIREKYQVNLMDMSYWGKNIDDRPDEKLINN